MQSGIKLLNVTSEVDEFGKLVDSKGYKAAPVVVLEVLACHLLDTYYIHDQYYRTDDDRIDSERYQLSSDRCKAMLKDGYEFGPKMVELLALSSSTNELLKLTKE